MEGMKDGQKEVYMHIKKIRQTDIQMEGKRDRRKVRQTD